MLKGCLISSLFVPSVGLLKRVSPFSLNTRRTSPSCHLAKAMKKAVNLVWGHSIESKVKWVLKPHTYDWFTYEEAAFQSCHFLYALEERRWATCSFIPGY